MAVIGRRDGAGVNPLTTLVRSLGTRGAVANAAAALEARRREDWLVQALQQRLDELGRPPAPVEAAADAAA
jgi:hypothetical protein